MGANKTLSYVSISQVIRWTYIYQHEKFEKKSIKTGVMGNFFLTQVKKQIFEGAFFRCY